MSKIETIFPKSELKYGLSLFSKEEISEIEKTIKKEGEKLLIKDQISEQFRPAKPEEIVRQLFLVRLLKEYNYPKEKIELEKVVTFGSRETGLADIAILKEDLETPLIIFEIKRPKRSDGLEQLKSYCNAQGAEIGVWSNGNEIILLHREEANEYASIPRIPKSTETLNDVLAERWDIKWLEENDELKKGNTTLKKIIKDLEELVLGNAGVEPFEEIFKIIYAKLFDEWNGINNPEYNLEFYVGKRKASEVHSSISNLLTGAKRQWSGVFEPTDKIELRDEHLKVCISFIEKIKLFNSNLQIIDEAFEYLIPQVSKKKEGQFFTPRPVEDMIIEMLNPKPSEFIIDPACGSGGFLLHSILHIGGGVFTGKELPLAARNFAQNNVVGIDFAKKAVKISKAINLIVGDGKTHIYKANALGPQNWEEEIKSGLKHRLIRYEKQEDDDHNQKNFINFDFDVLMTNPPFSGTIKEKEILRNFPNLAYKKGKIVSKIGRHILFIERSLQFLRSGGRMAIVIPQGVLNNVNTEYLRRYVIQEAKILGVIGLHVNSFKPHTGTKTSILLLQKFSDEEIQKKEELKIKFVGEWEQYFEELKKKNEKTEWNTEVTEIDEELSNFIDSFFSKEENNEEEDEEEDEEEKPEVILENELNELEEIHADKSAQLEKIEGKKEIKKLNSEIKKLNTKISKIISKLSEFSKGGRIWLTLNDEKMSEEFQKFWINGKLLSEQDYSIFMGVNEKPVKDNSGNYIFQKDDKGNFTRDTHGHLIIDHDLDEISKEFVKFAKKEKMDFW